MTAASLFSFCNILAMFGWVLLAVLPRWKYTRPVIFSGLVLLFAVAYSLIIATTFSTTEGGFGSLEQVAKLFENPWALLAGWVHYLAFDLITGCWISADARRIGIPPLALIPCLFFTFMLGPFGYLLYRIVRLYKSPQFLIDTHDTV